MPEASPRILVPVSESVTLRNTVAFAVREAERLAPERGAGATVHFVVPIAWREDDPTRERETEETRDLLERVRIWAREDLGVEALEDAESVSIETAIVGTDRYLFNPNDYADELRSYAGEHGLDRIVLDPAYQPAGRAPMLRPLEFEFERTDLAVEVAPVERPTRPARLVNRGTVNQFVVLFGASYLFYLAIGAYTELFDLVTGAVSAGIVAVLFHRVAFKRPPATPATAMRLGRMLVYAPYLLWEIAKANVELAYVILHPALPIDPGFVRYRAAVWGDLPVTTLANSITLTPGTLTVDVTRDEFLVHTMTAGSRRSLATGALERGVRFVFHGREAARIPSPTERGEFGPVEGEAAADGEER